MLIKTVFRACIFILITAVFACMPEEQVFPDVGMNPMLLENETDILLHQNSYARTISPNAQPTACTFEQCSTLLPILSAFYKSLANQTCKDQWYCATCCLENDITEITANVKPDSEYCHTVAGNEEVKSPLIPNLSVAILPNYCLTQGAMLWAVNPKKPGNPPYMLPTFTAKWYKNGHLIGEGALLSDCVCGEKIMVTVMNTMTGTQGSAMFLGPKCNDNG